MKIGVEGLKMPEAKKRGPLASLSHMKGIGMQGIFFSTVLDMSPTLDRGELAEIRAEADRLGMYLESGLGKVNPYSSAEAPELRAIGGGDLVEGFRRMMEASAQIGCTELWIATGNFKAQFPGRLANDRFRTDVAWEEQLQAMMRLLLKLAPMARHYGVHMNMETHDEITSFEILRLIEAVGDDAMGVVFDTANGLQRAEHPVYAAKRLAPFIRQTHIKDAYNGTAPGGFDFQTRPVGKGAVDFRTVLPIILAANPNLNLTIENAQSSEDKPRAKSPRQCIELDDPLWRASHPDLTVEEEAAYRELVRGLDARVASGEIPDWVAYETANYGYPSYEVQPFGYAATVTFIQEAAAYLRAVCVELGIAVEG